MPLPKKTRIDPMPAAAVVTARGHCRPFGATPEPGGVNFAVFSRNAERVHLVLFEENAEEPFVELPLDPKLHKTGDVWHIFVRDLPLDVLYSYRVFGPFEPEKGHRFNPELVVLDPYATTISGGHRWSVPEVPHGRPDEPLRRHGRILTEEFDWEDDVPLATPMGETVIYELHVRGFTCDPSSGVQHAGTFLGLTEKIPYLQSLGITAVELMPILEFDEQDQIRANPITGEPLKNYWGYSPISFFAPKASYAVEPGKQLCEFKQMVKTFHRAGIEVILDVVYNHTCEGNEEGPTVNFRGLDNSIYYLLDKNGKYHNFAGCGNTVWCNHPLLRDLI
ncbi:MAG: alpha-amylase family glycosyl hydrolase, partial [Thermoguttaceae bacterium]